jgi:hypothetical protein
MSNFITSHIIHLSIFGRVACIIGFHVHSTGKEVNMVEKIFNNLFIVVYNYNKKG